MSNTRSARLSQTDIDNIREMYTLIGKISKTMEVVQEQTAENTRTLRGHNGTEGLLTRFARFEGRIEDLDRKLDALKDVPEAIATWKRYPSLTWMVRHKAKEMAIVTASVISLAIFIGFPGTYIAERLQLAIELLFSKWLKL